MKRIDTRLIGIDQGDTILFSDYEDNGAMWTGTGRRMRRRAIHFAEPFRAIPSVHCALSMWDIDSATNARIEVNAERITRTGFDVVFHTWGDTRVARARVRWMAIGELLTEDDWELY